jgi:hypothetical protein
MKLTRYRHTCPACGVRHTCECMTDPRHPLARDGTVHFVNCPTRPFTYDGPLMEPFTVPGLVAVAMRAKGGALPRRLQPEA